MKLNKHRKIIVVIVIILVIIICAIVWRITAYNKDKELIKKQEAQAPTSATQLVEETNSKEELENEIDEKMKTILFGILKYTGEMEEQYDSEKVNTILNNEFKYSKGIFVSNRAKSKILSLLKETTDIEYSIDNDGYLKNVTNSETNDISKAINSLINGDKMIILDYNKYYYCKLGEDICTFNIEDIQYMQKFKQNNTIIMILNPTKYEQEYESNSDLVNQIINNVNS